MQWAVFWLPTVDCILKTGNLSLFFQKENPAPMAYFTKDYLNFLSNLAANNDREWFNANKKTYEEHVKKPFEVFIADLIDRTAAIDPSMLTTPKESIFRIYRDVRFSKDKSPYKTQMSAIVTKGGRKGMHNPGIYIQLSHEDARAYSGMYRPDKKQLTAIRDAIAAHPDTFQKLIDDKTFKKVFGEIRGEKNKRIPSEYNEAAEKQPLIYHKEYYYFKSWPADQILKDSFLDEVVDTYMASRPLGQFFSEAISGER